MISEPNLIVISCVFLFLIGILVAWRRVRNLPKDRPKISLHSWGHRELPLTRPDGQSLIFDHGFYVFNDGDAAFDVKIEEFTIDSYTVICETLNRAGPNNKEFIQCTLEKQPPIFRHRIDVALKSLYRKKHDAGEIKTGDKMEVPVSVIYRDLDNVWYRTRCELLFKSDFVYHQHGGYIAFSAPRQERILFKSHRAAAKNVTPAKVTKCDWIATPRSPDSFPKIAPVVKQAPWLKSKGPVIQPEKEKTVKTAPWHGSKGPVVQIEHKPTEGISECHQ